MIHPFDPGPKELTDYLPRELLWGAQMQAQALAEEYAGNSYDCMTYPDRFSPPCMYVGIPVGDGAQVVVSYEKARNKVFYHFAQSDRAGEPNDLIMLGECGGFDIALLALITRLVGEPVAG